MNDTTSHRDTILVVDDDPGILKSLSLVLEKDYEILTATSGDEAIATLSNRRDVYGTILDIRMPGKDGLETAREIREINKTVPIIFYTGYPGDYDRQEILRLYHPFGFLIKGNDPSILRSELRNAVTEQNLRFDPYRLTELARSEYGMICRSRRMLEIIRDVECFSPTKLTILILGEPGTGKELIAHALHRRSGRACSPFVPINCDHTSPNILKATLFGTESGIYTDAVKRDGVAHAASGGTIFLDEIADLHPESQSVLLRFMESGEVQRMGSGKTEIIDVRIVTATNKPIELMAREGRFRRDLLDRISRATIALPPLRHRREDIAELAQHFIAIACRESGRAERKLDPDASDLLLQHDWPKNVRGLVDTVHRLVVRSHWPTIGAENVRAELKSDHTPLSTETTYREDLDDLDRTYHVQLLARFKTVAEVARQKNCDPSNLRRKLKELDIDPGQFDSGDSEHNRSD